MTIRSVQDIPERLSDHEFALVSELVMGILPDEDLDEVEEIIKTNDLVIVR